MPPMIAPMSVLTIQQREQVDSSFHAAVRGRRLRVLREQIARGEYVVDVDALSEAILRRGRFAAELSASLRTPTRRRAA
jgi:hypothetical protein